MTDAGELFEEPDGPTKPKRVHHDWEHSLQVQIHKLARDFITVPHVFLAHDRSRRQSRFQHVREAARGVIAGILDTELLVLGFPDILAELKVPPNKPDGPQLEMISRLGKVGRIAFVAYSVTEWLERVMAVGVPFMPGAKVAALRMDGMLESARARVKAKAPRSYKPRKPRVATPSRRAIAIWNKMQAPR